MSDVFRKLVASTVFATCAAAASAQQVSVETGSADEAVARSGQLQQGAQGKAVRYSAGESIVLGAVNQAAQYRVPAPEGQAASVRYSAGDSIALGMPQATQNPRPAAPVQASQALQLDKTLGYSQPALIPLAAAFGDSVTTHIGIHHAALSESNGLVNTSPVGLVGLFVVKAGIIYYLDQQPKEIREAGLKATAGVWSGITMSNVLLIAGASNPLGLVGGALFGAYMYHREGLALAKEAARKPAWAASVPTAKVP